MSDGGTMGRNKVKEGDEGARLGSGAVLCVGWSGKGSQMRGK